MKPRVTTSWALIMFVAFIGLNSSATESAAADAVFPTPFNTERATNLPMSATEAAAKVILPPGFRCRVFAAEPDVLQPISMATDPQGRLWVAENFTYSENAVGYHPDLHDRILVFEDADDDGHFDSRKVFWDGAQRLTSVEVGLGGVWALSLPNLVFIPDENSDGVPDGPPQVMLDGFDHKRAGHTVANGLRWGPDGWLYGRQGILGGSRVGVPGTPDAARTALGVGIWRYHPTRRVFEVVAQGTTNPWGMDWDARGELFFINTVIGHLWHVIPGAHYRRMFGDDPDPHVYELIEQHADHLHWARGETWTDVRKAVTDATLAAGGGHAHTGLLIYQGGQWPTGWNGRLLTINFHGRRLNVERLERQGSGFVGRREPDAFLFADEWFRGIDLIAAPDGGIFVSDWSDTGECHDHDGIHRTSGRIYKLTHGAAPPAPSRSPGDLTKLGEIDLARLQTSTNDWLARQSRRVLADRARRGLPISKAREELERISASDSSEVNRLRAMWALHVSGGADPEKLRAKLTARESERSWAIRLLEDARHDSPAAAAEFEQLAQTILPRLATDRYSAPVRLTLASLLQRLPVTPRMALARALLRHAEDADDHNLPLMIWYGIEPLSPEPTFVNLIASAQIPRVQRLGARRVAEDIEAAPGPVDALLSAIARERSPASRQAVLDGLADGFAGRRKVAAPTSWPAVQAQLGEGANETLKARIRDLAALFGDGRAIEQIREVALNAAADLPRRRSALQSLIEVRAADLRAVCEKLLSIRDLTATAATGLALFDDPKVADRLLEEWPKLYGHERPAVMNALLSRASWAAKVVEAIAAEKLRRTDLAVVQARQIRGFNDAALTRRLGEVWGVVDETNEAGRLEALHGWRQRLGPDVLKTANPAAGQKLFANSCGACHRLYGVGGSLGPDLTGAGRQNLDYLLENIVFPNTVVPAEFRQSTLALKDGRVLSGIIRSRNDRTVVLEMLGASETIERSEITKEDTSPLSMMPEGLLEPLKPAEVVDLIGYLMSTQPPVAATAGK